MSQYQYRLGLDNSWGGERYFSKHLSQDGADSTYSANGDYSGAAVYWELRPDSGEIMAVSRIIVYIEDSGTINLTTYGGIAGGVTNGLDIDVVRGSGAGATKLYDVTDINVKTNGDWKQISFDTDVDGGGNGTVGVRWTFSKGLVPILLYGNENDALRITLNDSFTGLADQQFVCQGAKAINTQAS